MEYDDIIDYEQESTKLDFKAIQYNSTKHQDLLKDIISMANADVEDEKHIMVGVNHKASGQRDIVGIEEESFVDSAIYQQLIRENIEPYVKITYEPYEYNGKNDDYKGDLVGIFKIEDCDDKPYMMKKKYEGLDKGDAFIRKGTHQTPMTRSDLDKIYDKKASNDFDKNIKIGFKNTDFSKRIELSHLDKFDLPSDRAAQKIEGILEEKRNLEDGLVDSELVDIQKLMQGYTNPFSSTPYENRSIERLEKNLRNVKETYRDNDLYELFINSHTINFEILNKDTDYIKDAFFKLEIPYRDEIIVFKEFHEEPSDEPLFIAANQTASFEVVNYPDVYINKEENKFIAENNLENVKHHIPSDVYSVPLRILFNVNFEGETIELKGILYGENLVEPIKRSFFIAVK